MTRIPVFAAGLILILSFFRQEAWAVKGAVILVPGTFNSLVVGHVGKNPRTHRWEYHPYFSRTIIQTLRKEGLAVYTVKHLRPLGDFRINAKKALRQARRWYLKSFGDSRVPVTWVGHSAGGFYALGAAHFNQGDVRFPIERVITISTPYDGLELADRYLRDASLGRFFARLLGWTRSLFDLRGVVQMTTPGVRSYLNSLRLKNIQVIATAGQQPHPKRWFHRFDSRYLSRRFHRLGKKIGSESDGVVSVSSALGKQSGFPHYADDQLLYNLDHSEQVLGHRRFLFRGYFRVRSIQQTQERFFKSLAQAYILP